MPPPPQVVLLWLWEACWPIDGDKIAGQGGLLFSSKY
jgi:hypothetical protein